MSNIDGLSSLFSKLDKLNANIREDLEKSVNRNMKETVQAEAKLLCLVDIGDLRDSIEVKTEISGNEIVSTLYTNSDHAAYVEFGTGKVGEDTPVPEKYPGELSYKQDKWLAVIPDVGPRYIAGQPAQPFMYPALKNNEEKVIKDIEKDLKAAIRKVVKG